MKVKDLPLEDRPREKLMLRGAQNLSDSELLAILLRVGCRGKSAGELAMEILKKYENLAILAQVSMPALTKFNGLKENKAIMLAAVFEISRRILSQKNFQLDKKITSPKEIADIFIPLLRDRLKEVFIVICLNSANKIIKYEEISVGNLNSSIVHPREIFKLAVENSSANIIILHNHPSGNSEPSSEDIAITKRIVEAGKLMDIQVFDHIIVAGTGYLSFVEKRLI